MRLKPARAVRMMMVAASAAVAVVLVVSAPRLRAQQRPDVVLVASDGELQQLDPGPQPVEPAAISPPPTALPAPTLPETDPPRVMPSPSSTAAGAMADPEAAAFGFVERTTKEADDAIKSLAKEAETLRSRLQKVEAGLARWQAVKTSLEAHCERATWKARTPADSSVREGEPAAARRPPRNLDPEPMPDTEPPLAGSPKLPTYPEPGEGPYAPPPGPAEPKPSRPDAVAPPPIAPAPAPAPKPSDPAQKK